MSGLLKASSLSGGEMSKSSGLYWEIWAHRQYGVYIFLQKMIWGNRHKLRVVRQVCCSFWKLTLRVLMTITFDVFLLKNVGYFHLISWFGHKSAVMLNSDFNVALEKADTEYSTCCMSGVSMSSRFRVQFFPETSGHVSHTDTKHPFSKFLSVHSAWKPQQLKCNWGLKLSEMRSFATREWI